jgi:hypothetical protein
VLRPVLKVPCVWWGAPTAADEMIDRFLANNNLAREVEDKRLQHTLPLLLSAWSLHTRLRLILDQSHAYVERQATAKLCDPCAVPDLSNRHFRAQVSALYQAYIPHLVTVVCVLGPRGIVGGHVLMWFRWALQCECMFMFAEFFAWKEEIRRHHMRAIRTVEEAFSADLLDSPAESEVPQSPVDSRASSRWPQLPDAGSYGGRTWAIGLLARWRQRVFGDASVLGVVEPEAAADSLQPRKQPTADCIRAPPAGWWRFTASDKMVAAVQGEQQRQSRQTAPSHDHPAESEVQEGHEKVLGGLWAESASEEEAEELGAAGQRAPEPESEESEAAVSTLGNETSPAVGLSVALESSTVTAAAATAAAEAAAEAPRAPALTPSGSGSGSGSDGELGHPRYAQPATDTVCISHACAS